MRTIPKIWSKWYYRVVSYIILTVAVLLALGYIFMEKMLFPAVYTGEKAGNLTLQSGEALLDAVWLPQPDASGVILYSHGNGEDLAQLGPLLEEFGRRKYSILAYDYAGYGASTGRPGEKQAYRDIEAAYRYLTEKEKIAPERITVTGFSVGSGPSTYLAAKYPVKSLVLIAPLASAVQAVLPFSLPFDRFENARRLRNKAVPVLIFHGTADSIVPFRNGQQIFRQAAGRKKFISVPQADHNDIFSTAGETFWRELKDF